MKTEDTYLTLAGESEGLYKEKGSKFLAYAYPVETEEEIKEKVEALRKRYYDARHHCYAWVLGKDQKRFRANDDGEPGHSAGDPILGQIRSFDLTNTLIVVVRYFGGTKLGVPGLVHAYKVSAAEAIENGKIEEKIVEDRLDVYFEYLSMNSVMKLIKQYDLEIKEQVFDNQCHIRLAVRQTISAEVLAKFEKLDGVSTELTETEA
ncbi:hypothetical protein FUAX_35510 [Fulvitalea axinellae]|uniref:Impact N-terminal domain-containing protein n=1 Tax=Fulvitalea axinellae TaxID=1182444 RepID=A0AAU9D968_9BACT|nr:hypothetical protein FUAX_35510 [Fulvitalea axinellae]